MKLFRGRSYAIMSDGVDNRADDPNRKSFIMEIFRQQPEGRYYKVQ